MMAKLCFFTIFLVILTFTYGADDYCYSTDSNPFSLFGTKTSYVEVKPNSAISPPSGCSTAYIWHLSRHGTRYPTSSDQLSSQALTELRDKIVSNHDNKRGKLCTEDLEALKNWKYFWDENLFGKLAPQGKSDMENLATRLITNFPEFTKTLTVDKVSIQSSSKSRCQDSVIAFTRKLINSEVNENNIIINDTLLRTSASSDESKVDELTKYKQSSTIETVSKEITSRLGFESKITDEQRKLIYEQCSFEKALKPGEKSPFCCAFTSSELKPMEYIDDLAEYYVYGYGNSKGGAKACPLIQHLFKQLETAENSANPSQLATFMNSHSQMILPLYTILNLFHDDEALKYDNFEKQGSRKWRTSLMDSFSANVMFVLYKCSNEKKVALYINEALVRFPGCNEDLCSWNTFKEKFKDIVKKCPQNSSGASRLSSVKMPIIFLVYILFTFLNKFVM